MDITHDWYMSQIILSPDKKHRRTRNYIKAIKTDIGLYRLMALRRRGTFVGSYCSHEANRLEKSLRYALGESL